MEADQHDVKEIKLKAFDIGIPFGVLYFELSKKKPDINIIKKEVDELVQLVCNLKDYTRYL